MHVVVFKNLRKAGYASVETGVTAFEVLLQIYLLEFYIRGCGLNPLYASIAAGVAILWDGLTDPLIGHLSDQRSPRAKWGKRSPFIIVGALTLAISGVAIFNPPDLDQQFTLTLWFLISYLLVNTSMTLVAIPHIACVGDFVRDNNERNITFGWRLLFSNIGLLLGISLPGILATETTVDSGRSNAVAWIAAVLILTSIICVLSISGLKTLAPQQNIQSNWNVLLRSMKTVARNRLFFPLLLAFIISSIARSFNSGFALFYYKATLGLDEKTQVIPVLITFIVFIILSIPLWIALGKRFSKKRPTLVGIFILGILSCVTYPYFQPGSINGPLVMAVLGGLAVGSVLLIESMVLDVVDADESSTGQRKDGVYFGCIKLSGKIARAIGIGLTGPMLLWTGYDSDATQQDPATLEHIGNIFGWGAGSLFLLSGVALIKFKHSYVSNGN